MSQTRYIQNEAHYHEVLELVHKVKHSLWIGTADIKDLYVKKGTKMVPALSVFADLIQKKVAIRLIHAKEPGPNFKNDFDKFPILWNGLERMLCPRVHFKLMIFDQQLAYIGSANLTGAGLGIKNAAKRNFEAGILTNEPSLVNAAIEQFDKVWIGQHCQSCERKTFCGDRIK